WNPSILADEAGKATISFEAPDNLSGWRVLAMAVTPEDRMGLGMGKFAVNQPTEIRPVMPNQVVAGDQFEAGFSVMNRTSSVRQLKAVLTAKGPIRTPADTTKVEKIFEFSLSPFKRYTLWLPIQTTEEGEIRFTAKAWDNTDGDGITHKLSVNKRYVLETAAQYGSTTNATTTETILFPKEMRTDVGGVTVNVSPTVLGNLKGAFEYLKDYPYTCWEQILTKGVMAAHYNRLKNYLPSDFKWLHSEKLAQDTLRKASDFQAPGGGLTYYLPEDRYADPYLSAYTALAFAWLREAGYKIPGPVMEKLHAYLLTLLRRNTFPDFYSKGMASTVRAVALAALAKEGKIKISDLERYAPHVKEMSLFGKAQFLLAALSVRGTEKMQARVTKLILSHGNESAGKMVFSEVIDDSFNRILASPLRTDGAILSALTAYAQTDKHLIGDIPFKLVRFITQSRKKQDHWENTQANVFCMKGLIDYAGRYEAKSPDFTVRALFDREILGKAEFGDVRNDAETFSRPVQESDPGQTATIHLEKDGPGRLYYATRLSYAPLNEGATSVNAGIEIHREYSVQQDNQWRLLKSPMKLSRGDLVRIDLFVSLPAARNFVVVDDPVPGGLEPVNRDLATASTTDADQGAFEAAKDSWWFNHDDWVDYGISRWSFYHRELRHNAARFYSEYLPAGNYHLSYTAQVIAPGEFTVLPVRAQEMYDWEIYGHGVTKRLTVDQAENPGSKEN
ncbi:MAG: large extracellular alpha-helical protein, partial [Deltaproteobacteria bacterium]|nr:large extracellular alpha-helical protein [Deltaproteobacteria bacterium]